MIACLVFGADAHLFGKNILQFVGGSSSNKQESEKINRCPDLDYECKMRADACMIDCERGQAHGVGLCAGIGSFFAPMSAPFISAMGFSARRFRWFREQVLSFFFY